MEIHKLGPQYNLEDCHGNVSELPLPLGAKLFGLMTDSTLEVLTGSDFPCFFLKTFV